MPTILGVLYVVGVLYGLFRTDAPWPSRAALALAWPVGPLAGVVTIAGLLGVAAVAFPWFGVLLVGIITTFLWLHWR